MKVPVPFRIPSRRARVLAGAVLFAWALFHASTGIVWSVHFHPDERVVATWVAQTEEKGYVSDRVYPGGWFVLFAAERAVRRGSENLGRFLERRTRQTGAVDARFADSFRSLPEAERPLSPGIQEGRDFNVLLFAFSVLLLYAAALELGCGCGSAAFAALLFSVQPFPLEHAHYCETDLALAFSLCLGLWLAARSLRLRSAGWFLAASFAAGFAAACKYSLAPVFICIPAVALPLARLRAESGRTGPSALRLSLAGLALGGAGFLAGTPALLLDPAFFFGNLRSVSSFTWGEADEVLGAGASYWTRVAWRGRSLLREMAACGPAALACFAVSAAAWCRRDALRRFYAVPLFLVLFVLSALFAMPWIRQQETLAFFPVFCLGAALAAGTAARAVRPGRTARARLAAAAVLAVLGAGFLSSFAGGSRVLSCFSNRDTRARCRNWMARNVVRGVPLAVDRYATKTVRGVSVKPVETSGVAESWTAAGGAASAGDRPYAYVLRNASFFGRRDRSAEEKASAERFEADCALLGSWKISPGRNRTITFSQPDIELWALPPSGPGADLPDVPLVPDRPVYFPPGMLPLHGFRQPAPVGSVRALPAVGRRHVAHPASGSPLWAVSRVLRGPARGRVAWDALFRPRSAPLGTNGIAVARLDETAFACASRFDVLPAARVRLLGADDQDTACATWFATDAAEVARALRRAGDPRAALRFLRELPSLDAGDSAEAFLAAADAGETPLPEWTAAARDALAAFEAARAAGFPDGVRVRGVPLSAFRDFSVLRFEVGQLLPTGELPVFLPAGTYDVSFVRAPGVRVPDGVPLIGNQVGDVRETRWPDGDRDPLDVLQTTVRLDRDGLLVSPAMLASAKEGRPAFSFVEIRWDPVEQFEARAAELRAALESVP